jgi:hypothetical protein
MKKKFIYLTIIGTYLIFILSAPIGLAISSEIEFDIGETEIVDPIKPSESNELTFNVKFKLNLSGLQKIFYFNRRIGRVIAFGLLQGYFFRFLKQLPKANVSLSVEKPVWCQADINEIFVELDYDNVFQEAQLKLTITPDNNAPALQKGDITIIASYPGVGSIDGSTITTNISFMPAYVSNISVEAKSNYSIPPKKQSILSINVTNNGNGESKVNLSGFDKEDWNITTYQENIIDSGETKEIIIGVKPPKNFDNESISFTLEPVSTAKNVDNKYLLGENVEFSIIFYNDGSLKDEEDDIDITSVIIIAFVLIIILIIVFLLLRKKE